MSKNWGNKWTKEKLDAFEKYVSAYLIIMTSQKKVKQGWPTIIYFDGFAGSGTNWESIDETENLFSEYFEEDESNLYKGSAERVLSLEKKFDRYYFVDNNQDNISNLKETLKSKNISLDNCFFINDDVNNYLIEFHKIIDNNVATLILLDPFGMQVEWESIKLLANKRVDLWILIPSGVAINRLIDKKGKLKNINILEKTLGISEETLIKEFYNVNEKNTFFGPEKETIKIKDSINKISEFFIQQLKSIFKYVSEEPLKLINTKNIILYHFIFASNNETALKIANYIIQKK